MASKVFQHPRPAPRAFTAPRTQQEISAAALDGDPMTGLEVQTALDGNAVDEARLRAAFDGDSLTRDPSEGLVPMTAHQRTQAALDGDTLTRPDVDLDPPEPPRKLRLPTPWDRPAPKPPGA